MKTIHDFIVNTLSGNPLDLSSLKGKKILIVNTASLCGLTPQYRQLQELYENFSGNGFEIIGFPSNDFGNQEPGTADEIKQFCEINYKVTFPLMEKIKVTGAEIHPIYKWLTQKAENGIQDAEVTWNFQKFMINEKGEWAGMVAPPESPFCDKIINWINEK
jgi:glutathione peroxidase